MKNIIIYFSSTGNSFYAAKFLAKYLENCICLPITKFDTNSQIGDADTNVGFIFPTYFFSIPKFFSEMVETLNLKNQAYYYGITTCNGFPGNAGHQLKMLIKSKDCELSFFRTLHMPGNYIMEYAPPKDRVINKRLSDAEKKLVDIAIMVENRKQDVIKKRYALVSSIFRKVMYRNQHKWHKGFYTTHK